MFIYILPPKKYIYIPSRNKQSVPPPPVRPSTKKCLKGSFSTASRKRVHQFPVPDAS